MKLVYDEDSGSFLHLRMEEPYHGQVMANRLALTLFTDILEALDFDSCYDFDCQDYSRYGFENPKLHLVITYVDGNGELQDYLMEVGDKNGDDQYYVRTNLTNNVNLLNGTNGYNFLTFNVFDTVYHSLYIGTEADVKKITIEAGGKTFTMTPDADDADKVALSKAVREILLDSETKPGKQPGSEVCRITMEWKDKTDVWTFFEYEENSLYLVDINGKDQSFTVTKASMDDILSKAGLQ